MGIYNINQILHEVYFGRTNDMIELEKIIGKMRKDGWEHDKIWKKSANTSKYVLEFNRKIEETFGFYTFCLEVEYDDVPNAYTLPISMSFDVWNEGKYFKPTSKGMKFDKKAKYSVVTCISSGLLLNKEFTDREILAVLLHEIGHNFSSAFDKNCIAANAIKKSIFIAGCVEDSILWQNPRALLSIPINVLISSNIFKQLGSKLTEALNQKFKTLSNVMNTIQYYQSCIKNIFSTLNLLPTIVLFLTKPFLILKNIAYHLTPANFAKMVNGFKDEKMSDNMATMYGYGADLSSALVKLELPQRNRIFSTVVGLPLQIIFGGLNCHPRTGARINNQIDYLEKELRKKNLDPKMEKVIKQEIKDTRDTLDEYINPEKGTKLYKCNKIYNALVCKLFGGDSRNMILATDTHEEIENSFSEKIKNVKIK